MHVSQTIFDFIQDRIVNTECALEYETNLFNSKIGIDRKRQQHTESDVKTRTQDWRKSSYGNKNYGIIIREMNN